MALLKGWDESETGPHKASVQLTFTGSLAALVANVVRRPLRVPRRGAPADGRDGRALESAGFEVRDVESLREHYALTLRAWVGNLEANWDRAVQLSSAGRAVWRLYMAGSALAFEGNRIGVYQVLAVRPDVRGVSGMPRSRASMLAPGVSAGS